MLPATSRLRRRLQFTQVMRSGRRLTVGRGAVTPARLVLHWYSDTTSAGSVTPPRLGLIIGRGVGNAVQRHRLARQLRHLMRYRLTDLPAGTDVVIRALPISSGAKSTELGVELDALLGRIYSGLGVRIPMQHAAPNSAGVPL